MAKYKKKPIVIEAVKLGYNPYPQWFHEAFEDGYIWWRKDTGGTELAIETLEGVVTAYEYEHYIIKGTEGEIYPCRVDIFEKTYELVGDENNGI